MQMRKLTDEANFVMSLSGRTDEANTDVTLQLHENNISLSRTRSPGRWRQIKLREFFFVFF